MRKAAIGTTLLVLAIFLAGGSPAAAALYKYKNLDSDGLYWDSYVRGINASGQVAGWARSTWGDRGFFHDGSVMHTLPTLPAPYNTGCYVTAVNASGQVVGYCTSSSSGNHAFIWSISGGMQDLGLILGAPGEANGINDAGQVVGFYYLSGLRRAFLYTPGVGVETIATLPGGNTNQAKAINNAGQVTGISNIASSFNDHAFLYTPGAGVADLGCVPGAYYSWGKGINNLGEVVGESGYRAFLWTSTGGMQNLGTLGGESCAYSINDLGQVTGGYVPVSRSLAFIYSGGRMVDLSSLVLNLPEGTPLYGGGAINNKGQIAVTAGTSYGDCPYLLTPVAPPGAAIDLLLQ